MWQLEVESDKKRNFQCYFIWQRDSSRGSSTASLRTWFRRHTAQILTSLDPSAKLNLVQYDGENSTVALTCSPASVPSNVIWIRFETSWPQVRFLLIYANYQILGCL